MRKGDLSREQILRAALQVFIKKGYHGTSITDLCEATGFTRGALYHHFKDKDELYHQSLGLFFEEARIPEWIENEFLGFSERLERSFTDIEASRSRIQDKVGVESDDAILLFYTFLYEATRRYPEYQAAIDHYDDQKQEQLGRVIMQAQEKGEIRADQDPFLLAIELDALLQQLTYLRFVNPRINQNPSILHKIMENYRKRLILPGKEN